MMFTSPIFQMLERGLDAAALRQETISDNLANINTPNYKAKKVQFQTELDGCLSAYRTSSRHIPFNQSSGQSMTVARDNSTMMNNNGNNVDLDKEMTDLAKNEILNQALVQRLNGKFNSLQMVIKGGK
ncbi:flagellar basal body rod protein FlgB [Fictibacillus sp. NRS-1165]|uniref:flagellar basal body rod protein FlgB n=1 Tax=Fictibacillus sp. NRS-1165 TaxID=3144463 RepID=UPI003D19DC2E